MTLYAHWQYIETANSNTNTNLTSPKTGYTYQIALMALIFGLSLFGISCIRLKNIK